MYKYIFVSTSQFLMLVAYTNLENILLKYYTAFQIALTKLEFTTFFTSDRQPY